MIQPMCQLSIMLKEVFGQTRNVINTHPYTPLEAAARRPPFLFFLLLWKKVCILCKQGEISGLVTDTKAQVVSFVSCAAAAFAATSALTFPVEIKLLSLVCAAHLQIATLSGKRMASKSSDTSDAFNIGCPSDFKKKSLCFQSAPKSCMTPKA